MATTDPVPPKVKLRALRAKLLAWLTDSAYPLWAHNGVDPQNGGFIETLTQNGSPLPLPRRARVHPRQMYAFAEAPALGWTGDARGIVARGMRSFLAFYQRPDGLFRTLAGPDGAPLDERALLYDQAFALLGYAAAAVALELRGRIEQRFAAEAEAGAFHSGETAGFLESNPHMHLLEACLAWAEIGTDLGWTDWVRHVLDIAMQRFVRRGSGALGEAFTAQWLPAPGIAGRIVEPGHQYEWAWLMLRSETRHPGALREAALRLIAIGEESGVHNQVAVNALLDDFSIHDPNARCWPQTERLKAALIAARLSGDDKYWSMAAAAAQSLLPYLETPVAGLWFDVQLPSGELVDSPAPASTFYHLVGAIAALDRSMAAA